MSTQRTLLTKYLITFSRGVSDASLEKNITFLGGKAFKVSVFITRLSEAASEECWIGEKLDFEHPHE